MLYVINDILKIKNITYMSDLLKYKIYNKKLFQCPLSKLLQYVSHNLTQVFKSGHQVYPQLIQHPLSSYGLLTIISTNLNNIKFII